MISAAEILVIEDNTVDGMFIAKTLRDSNIPNLIRVLESCEKAMDYLLCTGEFEQRSCPPPSLIILDLKHRGMSGFEFLSLVRSNPQFSDIPIVVFSDSRAEHDRSMALSMGANGFFNKSVDLNSYLQSIKTIANIWLLQGVPS